MEQLKFCYKNVDQKKTGARIKQLLDEKGISSRELQEICGFTTPQAIYKWFWGQSFPDINNLVLLAQLLDTSIDNILVLSD